MFISLSSSSSSSAAENAENLTGSQSKVRRLTKQAVCVLLKSGTVTRRTSCPQGPVGRKEDNQHSHFGGTKNILSQINVPHRTFRCAKPIWNHGEEGGIQVYILMIDQ